MKINREAKAALYMRLSKDDDGINESASIGTQRKILREYAEQHSIEVYDEYVDDGYSGTNFDRPGFQKMLEDLYSGRVNLILIKDLSRFGREHLGTGHYLEIDFPEKEIRVIGVTDSYDSNKKECAYMAPFMNLVNEAYAKDISGKIRAAFQSKMTNGQYIGSFAPYGYRKDEANKNHLLINPETATVVADIFQLAVQGMNPSSIAKALNEKGILTPAMYRCAQNPKLRIENYSKRQEWTAATIAKMLKNTVYLGHLEQGKTKKISFKIKRTKRQEPENWVRSENTHEAIIDQEMFDLAQKMSKSRLCRKQGEFCNIFSGLARCADCGRNMSAVGSRKKDSPVNLTCGGYKLYGAKECRNHFIEYTVLYEIVLQVLRDEIQLTTRDKESMMIALEEKLEKKSKDRTKEAEIIRMKNRKAEIDRTIDRLYKDYAKGNIGAARFERMVNENEAEYKNLTEKLHQLDAALDSAAKEKALRKAHENLDSFIKEYTDMAHLSAIILHKLIDHIEVEQGHYEMLSGKKVKKQKVNIHFRFTGDQAMRTVYF